MLGFIVSTIAFFVAAYAIGQFLNSQDIQGGSSRKMFILVLATIASIGVGWLVDKMDGDADLPRPSVAEVIHSGDPMQMAKMLSGIN